MSDTIKTIYGICVPVLFAPGLFWAIRESWKLVGVTGGSAHWLSVIGTIIVVVVLAVNLTPAEKSPTPRGHHDE